MGGDINFIDHWKRLCDAQTRVPLCRNLNTHAHARTRPWRVCQRLTSSAIVDGGRSVTHVVNDSNRCLLGSERARMRGRRMNVTSLIQTLISWLSQTSNARMAYLVRLQKINPLPSRSPLLPLPPTRNRLISIKAIFLALHTLKGLCALAHCHRKSRKVTWLEMAHLVSVPAGQASFL